MFNFFIFIKSYKIKDLGICFSYIKRYAHTHTHTHKLWHVANGSNLLLRNNRVDYQRGRVDQDPDLKSIIETVQLEGMKHLEQTRAHRRTHKCTHSEVVVKLVSARDTPPNLPVRQP